jgi:hypothetical protein
MAWSRRRIAQAVLGLSLTLPCAGGMPPRGARGPAAKQFNAKAAPDAPAYDPVRWNDLSDKKIAAFYETHQGQLEKIARHEGRMYVWPLAQVLYKNSDRQLHDKYGLTLAEAKEFRAAFNDMAAGYQLRNNCYSYAIGHPDNPPGWKLSPGEKAGLGIAKENEFDNKDLLRLVKADGLTVAGNDPKPRQGYYLIAMFVIPGEDFHFVRQNDDGSWSQKSGEDAVTSLDFKGRPITDPRQADVGEYKFVSYLYVPKGGLKFDHPMHQPPAKHRPAPRKPHL